MIILVLLIPIIIKIIEILLKLAIIMLLLFIFILIIFVLKRLYYFYSLNSIKKYLDLITNNKKILDNLKKEDKLLLALTIDKYLNNKLLFKRSLKKDLYSIALGYSLGQLGINRILKYGVGYLIFRKFIYNDINKFLKNKS